nr:cyclin G2 [Hymenolepis microstoma]
MIETERLPISTNVSSSAHSSAFSNGYQCISRNPYLRSDGSPVFAGHLYYSSVFAQQTYFSTHRNFALSNILPLENQFNANISGLLSVNPVKDDRADASMRDESLRRLLSLHRAYYDLSSLTFCKAVYLVDVFITRVKVKPRYMMILTMACYYIASKFDSIKQMPPTLESLVRMADCGGSSDDLLKMVQIVLTKLGTNVIAAIGSSSATALDFLSALLSDANRGVPDVVLPTFLLREVENALCSTKSAQFRPACLAIALLVSYKQVCPPPCVNDSESPAFKILETLEFADLRPIADFCNISWDEVEACSRTLYEGGVLESYSPAKSSVPLSRVMWCLAKRKRLSVSISVPPKLKTICESGEAEMEE